MACRRRAGRADEHARVNRARHSQHRTRSRYPVAGRLLDPGGDGAHHHIHDVAAAVSAAARNRRRGIAPESGSRSAPMKFMPTRTLLGRRILRRSGLVFSAALLGSWSVGAQILPSASNRPSPVTFTNDVAPIVFQHCATCHRPGELAPFSLLTYDDVKQHARQIAVVTTSRFMPPWKPAPPEPGLAFAGARGLTDGEI